MKTEKVKYLCSEDPRSFHVQQLCVHVDVSALLELHLLVQRCQQDEDCRLDAAKPDTQRRSSIFASAFVTTRDTC